MAIAAYSSQILIASLPSVPFTNIGATSAGDNLTWNINIAADRYIDPSVAVVVQTQYDEVQTVTITGGPTGGTFTLTFGANTTTPIAYNASAATVQAALQALASIGANNMLVTGAAGGPYTCQFTAGLGLSNVAAMTAANTFTGGASPGVTIATVQTGAIWANITTGFTVFRCNARIVFTTVQYPGTYARFHSGNYLPYATLAEAATCDVNFKMAAVDTTTFVSATASNGAKSFTPTILDGTLKYSSFWINNARATSLIARDLLMVSFVTPTGNRYEGFCYAGDCDIKDDVKGVVLQDLTFQLTNEFFNA